MKFGMRTPSLKRIVSARTTGAIKRSVKKSVIPMYGQKGMGLLNPKKAIYNKIYRRTTFSVFDLAKAATSSNGKGKSANSGCCIIWIFIITALTVSLLSL